MNFLDLFAQKLREKREQKKITQRELAERLNMCTRTVIEIEKCKSNPKFETVALISEEMDISLDGIVFHDRAPQTVAKCVLDYFAGKGEEESQRYIDLCMRFQLELRTGDRNRQAMQSGTHFAKTGGFRSHGIRLFHACWGAAPIPAEHKIVF